MRSGELGASDAQIRYVLALCGECGYSERFVTLAHTRLGVPRSMLGASLLAWLREQTHGRTAQMIDVLKAERKRLVARRLRMDGGQGGSGRRRRR